MGLVEGVTSSGHPGYWGMTSMFDSVIQSLSEKNPVDTLTAP